MEERDNNINLTNSYEARLKEENEKKRQARYVKVTQTPPYNNQGGNQQYHQNGPYRGQPGKPGQQGRPVYVYEKKKPGVGRIIAIGAICIFFLSALELSSLIPLGIIGFFAYKFGKKFLNDNKEYVDTTVKEEPVKKEPEKVKKEEIKKEPKFTTGDPEIDRLIDEKEKAVIEMRRLNAAIEDPTISAQIDHLEEVTTKILNYIIQNPSKKSQVNRFFNYYLPTTLKLLNAYDRMDDTGISGMNIDGTKGKVEEMMKTAMAAFDKQLDALFAEDALDVATDIKVMENLLKSEGLTEDDMTLSI